MILSTQWVDILLLFRVSKRLIASMVTLLFPFESPEKAFFMITTKNTARWLFSWSLYCEACTRIPICWYSPATHTCIPCICSRSGLFTESWNLGKHVHPTALTPAPSKLFYCIYTESLNNLLVNEKAGIENNVLWCQCAGRFSCCIMLPYIFKVGWYIIKSCHRETCRWYSPHYKYIYMHPCICIVICVLKLP